MALTSSQEPLLTGPPTLGNKFLLPRPSLVRVWVRKGRASRLCGPAPPRAGAEARVEGADGGRVGMEEGWAWGVSQSPRSSPCRHALPLFTSLLNTVCAYDPVGYGIPYNHLLFSDYREPLVEEAAQVLIVTLDHDSAASASPTVDGTTTGTAMDDVDVRTGGGWGLWPGGTPSSRAGRGIPSGHLVVSRGVEGAQLPRPGVGAEDGGTCSPRLHSQQPPGPENLFVNYLSRIHREEVSLNAHPTGLWPCRG